MVPSTITPEQSFGVAVVAETLGAIKTSTNEWIDDAHAGVLEISTISRDDRQTVDERRRRDEAILDRHGFPGRAKTRQQFRPFQPRVRVPGKTMETPDPRVEPAFQGGPLPSLGKDENPETEFAENDGIDGDLWLMCAKPRHDPRIGRWFRRLAQNVGIHQVLHSASVDSESIGTKKSFCGQASSHVNGALVRRSRTPDEAIVPSIDTLDVELLPRLDTVHLPELRRQNDLALGGDGGLHVGKIPSYLPECQALRAGNHDKHQ